MMQVRRLTNVEFNKSKSIQFHDVPNDLQCLPQPPTQTLLGVRHAFLHRDETVRTSAWEAMLTIQKKL